MIRSLESGDDFRSVLCFEGAVFLKAFMLFWVNVR
jgi:hypothetical protein